MSAATLIHRLQSSLSFPVKRKIFGEKTQKRTQAVKSSDWESHSLETALSSVAVMSIMTNSSQYPGTNTALFLAGVSPEWQKDIYGE